MPIVFFNPHSLHNPIDSSIFSEIWTYLESSDLGCFPTIHTEASLNLVGFCLKFLGLQTLTYFLTPQPYRLMHTSQFCVDFNIHSLLNPIDSPILLNSLISQPCRLRHSKISTDFASEVPFQIQQALTSQP